MDGNAEDLERLKNSINSSLEQMNDPGKGYRVHFSIGSSRWTSGMDSKALIAAADEDLYKEKAKKPLRSRVLAMILSFLLVFTACGSPSEAPSGHSGQPLHKLQGDFCLHKEGGRALRKGKRADRRGVSGVQLRDQERKVRQGQG